MSVILLDSHLKPKIYYVTGVPTYTSIGVGKKFPTLLGAAMGLREAVKNNCDEICVEVQGRLPRRYKTSYIMEKCKNNPSLRQYLPQVNIPFPYQHLSHYFSKTLNLYK